MNSESGNVKKKYIGDYMYHIHSNIIVHVQIHIIHFKKKQRTKPLRCSDGYFNVNKYFLKNDFHQMTC